VPVVYLRIDGFYVGVERRGPSRGPTGVQKGNALVDISGTLELCGVERGMSPTVARRICPHLEILPWNENFRSPAEEIRGRLTSITPFIEAIDFHESFLACSEKEALRIPGLIPGAGYRIVISIASSKFVARAAGMGAEGSGLVLRRVEEGKERQFIAPFPVDLLEVPGDIKEALRRLGAHRMGDICFSTEELERLFGPWAHVINQGRNGQGDSRVKVYGNAPWVTCEHLEGQPLDDLIKHKLKALTDSLEAGSGIGFLSITLTGDGPRVVWKKTFPQRVTLPGLLRALPSFLEMPQDVTELRLEAGDFGPAGISQGVFFGKPEGLGAVITGLKRRYGPSVISAGKDLGRRERVLALWDPLRGGRYEPQG